MNVQLISYPAKNYNKIGGIVRKAMNEFMLSDSAKKIRNITPDAPLDMGPIAWEYIYKLQHLGCKMYVQY